MGLGAWELSWIMEGRETRVDEGSAGVEMEVRFE